MNAERLRYALQFLAAFAKNENIESSSLSDYHYYVASSFYGELIGHDLAEFYDRVRYIAIHAEGRFSKRVSLEEKQRFYDDTAAFAHDHYRKTKSARDLLDLLKGIPYNYWGPKYPHIEIFSKEGGYDIAPTLASFVEYKFDKQGYQEGWDYFLYLEGCLAAQVSRGENATINQHYLKFIEATLGDDDFCRLLMPMNKMLSPLRRKKIRPILRKYYRLKQKEANHG